MTRMTRSAKKILIFSTIAALVWLSIGVLRQIGKTGLDDFYSPFQYSHSIATARETGRLVSIPKLETQELRLGNLRFLVKEVWIEKQIQVNHRWFRYREETPIGYRLMVALTDLYPSGTKAFHEKSVAIDRHKLICNDTITIEVSRSLGDISFTKITPPFPTSIKLEFKDTGEK